MIVLLGVLVASCDDFLDREPLDQVTPEKYFTLEEDLAAYTINLYPFASTPPGAYGIGVFGYDNGTDNQAAAWQSNFWMPGEKKVPDKVYGGSGWDFGSIRHCNYFLEKVLPKYEEGAISGNKDNIKHYIGEIYVIRAYNYFNKLKSLGDLPIVTTALPDDEEVLIEASKREPRHKVARFILEDLDKAISMLKDVSPVGKNRISRDVALLLKSRVALFEASWLTYHKGTAFVPGGPGWPGNQEALSGFNIDTEINFFLKEAMSSSKELGDKIVNVLAENTATREGMDANLSSLNPYYTMFCDNNMEGYAEVLMWRQFNKKDVSHNIQMQLCRNAGGTGWTRGLVNSFLMSNGLPIYAGNSGYSTDRELQGVNAVLEDRDSRIVIFTKKDNDISYFLGSDTTFYTRPNIFDGSTETRAITGYTLKKGKHYDGHQATSHHSGVSGSVVFRGVEALLNYMEASYMLNNSVDATASKYWKAIRRRAHVDEDFNKTIAATDMNEEAKWDFGAYSKGKLVDPTLYNIRRERRNELIGEGFRFADLKRWRACDQVNGYQIEGIRYWGSAYEGNIKNDAGQDMCKVDLSGNGNMSSEEISGVYLRPYQITKVSNLFFDGLKFTPAHYLDPIPQSVFRLTSTDESKSLDQSVVYQNPGWGKVSNEGAKPVQ